VRLMMLLSLALMLLGAGLAIAEGTFLLKFGGESSGAGRLLRPRDVAIDASGNAWIADTAHNRVQKFNSSGEFVSQFGVESEPTSIDLDSEGNVWVATTDSFGSTPKVRKYKQTGELILSFGSQGSGNGQFTSLRGIATDPSGNVWTLEAGNEGVLGEKTRVQKFNSKGEYLAQFGKQGTGNGEFKTPEAIVADSEGNILVADTGNNRVQEFNSAAEFVRKYGEKGTGNGQFESPRGIAVDSEGRVWVTDSGNDRIQRFSAKGTYQAQCGSYGPNDLQFSEPRGIATSGTNVYVADTGNDRVQKVSC
jgi:tripartite motif-containing protein 71